MSNRVLHPHDPAVEPMLEATDIPWGCGGMSVGVIDALRAEIQALRLRFSA